MLAIAGPSGPDRLLFVAWADLPAWVGMVSGLGALAWNVKNARDQRPKVVLRLLDGYGLIAQPPGTIVGWDIEVFAKGAAAQVLSVQLEHEPFENFIGISGPAFPRTIAADHVERWEWRLPSGRGARGIKVRAGAHLADGVVLHSDWRSFGADELMSGQQYELDGTPAQTRVQVLRDAENRAQAED